MKSYVWLTFGFMGWAYYEVSGGADFVPEQPAPLVAAVEGSQEDGPEIVTRAQTPALLAVSASNVTPAPRFTDNTVTQAVSDATALDSVEAQAAEPVEVVAEVDQASAPPIDLREVAGSRVNMRMGPGTTFDVIATLDGGTALEVLEVNEDGWANVATVDRSVEGWMAERLLTAPET